MILAGVEGGEGVGGIQGSAHSDSFGDGVGVGGM